MDPIHDLVLTRGGRFLTKNLQVDHAFLIALVSDEIISDHDMELVLSNATRVAKASCILDLLKTKGPAAFEALISAAAENGQGFIGDYLQEAVANTKESFPGGFESEAKMDPIHRDILRQNLPYLAERLEANSSLLAHLTSEGLLSREERQNIKKETEQDEKVFSLYDILVQKPPSGYQAFLDAMEATGQNAIVTKLIEDERAARQQGSAEEDGAQQEVATADLQDERIMHREIQFLVANLSISLVFLTNLVLNDVISPAEKELLMKPHLNKKQKILRIRDVVSSKGHEGVKGFLTSLSASDQERVKSHMERALADSESQEATLMEGAMSASDERIAARSAGTTVTMSGAAAGEVEKPQTVGLSYNTKDQWEIPKASLLLKHQIGHGKFANVYEGLWNMKMPVAIKTIKTGTMDAKDFLAVAEIMKKLRHPKLIQLYAVSTQDEPVYIVMELMCNGCLLEYLQGKGKSLGFPKLIDVAAQIAQGMAYIESQNCIHRDLAARNILVGVDNSVKIASFGRAKVIKEHKYEAQVGERFATKWTAPEAAHYNCFTIKSDVWSFGILLTEIVTYGRVPYPGMTNAEVLHEVEHGYRMPCPPGCPATLYEIMLESWKKDENTRPTFETLHWKLEDFFTLDGSEYCNLLIGSHY